MSKPCVLCYGIVGHAAVAVWAGYSLRRRPADLPQMATLVSSIAVALPDAAAVYASRCIGQSAERDGSGVAWQFMGGDPDVSGRLSHRNIRNLA